MGTNSIRAEIHFTDIKDNNFDNFITPNANKSNSTFRESQEIVEKITALVKFIVRTDFTMNICEKKKKETRDEERLRVWKKQAGENFYSTCNICKSEQINAITFKMKKVESTSPGTKGICFEKICCEECYKL